MADTTGQRADDPEPDPRRPVGCYPCEREGALDDSPASERIWVGPHWRAVHAIRCALPGWLVLVPRRHVETLADLTPAEAVELGRLQVAASAALHAVTGCRKTYVAQFAEAEGFSHTHIHVVPRADDLPDHLLGPGIFAFLDRPEAEWVGQDAMDALAARLGPLMTDAVAAHPEVVRPRP